MLSDLLRCGERSGPATTSASSGFVTFASLLQNRAPARCERQPGQQAATHPELLSRGSGPGRIPEGIINVDEPELVPWGKGLEIHPEICAEMRPDLSRALTPSREM